MSTTPASRIAEAGRCHCGSKIVRGNDQHGHLATADVYAVDAATELLAHTQGRSSYVLALARPRGLVLTRRSPRDLVRKPPGFNRDHICIEHRCPPRKDPA